MRIRDFLCCWLCANKLDFPKVGMHRFAYNVVFTPPASILLNFGKLKQRRLPDIFYQFSAQDIWQRCNKKIEDRDIYSLHLNIPSWDSHVTLSTLRSRKKDVRRDYYIHSLDDQKFIINQSLV